MPEESATTTTTTTTCINCYTKYTECCLIPQRVVLTILCFFCAVLHAASRVSISHIIIVMTAAKPVTNETKKNCDASDIQMGDTLIKGTYEWSEQTQGLILGLFYLGYLVAHLPSGVIADRFGGKGILGWSVLYFGIVLLITPIATMTWNVVGLIVMRILAGIGQATFSPAVCTLISAWIPMRERGTLGVCIMSGMVIGLIIGFLGTGYLLSIFEWPIIFYIYGTLNIIWFGFFMPFCSSYPYDHRCIKQKERDYLAAEIEGSAKPDMMLPVPWIPIFKNKVIIWIAIANIGQDWGMHVIISYLPKYMSDILSFEIVSNGVYTALPFFSMWISAIVCGIVADVLIHRKLMSLTNIRKIMNGISTVFPSLFLISASYAGCNHTAVIICFAFGLVFMGPYYVGLRMSPIDVSLHFSGTIMALVNGLGSIIGLLVPVVVSSITANQSIYEWRIVFYMTSAIKIVSSIGFTIWGSAERQEFDYIREKNS